MGGVVPGLGYGLSWRYVQDGPEAQDSWVIDGYEHRVAKMRGTCLVCYSKVEGKVWEGRLRVYG